MNNELKKLHEYVNQFNDMNDFIFNAFKKNIYKFKPCHFGQYKFVTNINSQIDVKYIFYFETLNNDIMTLQQLNLSMNMSY